MPGVPMGCCQLEWPPAFVGQGARHGRERHGVVSRQGLRGDRGGPGSAPRPPGRLICADGAPARPSAAGPPRTTPLKCTRMGLAPHPTDACTAPLQPIVDAPRVPGGVATIRVRPPPRTGAGCDNTARHPARSPVRHRCAERPERPERSLYSLHSRGSPPAAGESFRCRALRAVPHLLLPTAARRPVARGLRTDLGWTGSSWTPDAYRRAGPGIPAPPARLVSDRRSLALSVYAVRAASGDLTTGRGLGIAALV